jgi:hypothetical protein
MAELRHETDERLWQYLTERLPDLDATPEARRVQLLRLTRSLLARSWPTALVLSGVRSTADVLHELEALPPPDDVMQREDVRRFIAENAVSTGQRGRQQPSRETRRAERERLTQFITSAIRDARSAKARHEIKKTRRVLLRIDQRQVRRVLGRDGDELCHQINAILRATAALF